MATQYVGLFGPDKHFNIVGTYEVEQPYAPVLVQLIVGIKAQVQCWKCGKMFSGRQNDVAHSNWPDGRDAQYPHKLETAGCPKAMFQE